jgi:predicted nuclease with TOPRIM domain
MQYTIETQQVKIVRLESEKNELEHTVKNLDWENHKLYQENCSLEDEISRLKYRTCPRCHTYV